MSIYIIPDIDHIPDCMAFSTENHLGWEFNDFMYSDILDNKEETMRMINQYLTSGMPEARSLHGAFLDVTVHSSDEKIREISDLRIRQSLAAAKALQCQKVVFHTNCIPNYYDQFYCDNWVRKNADYWTAKAERQPATEFLMENMFDMTPYLLLRMAEEMNAVSNFGICLDYAHSEVFGAGEGSSGKFIRSLAPYIKHIHLNDCDLRHDLHLSVGEGKLNWDQFAELYGEFLNGVSILIEVNGIEKQKRSLDFLRELFARRGLTI